MVWCLLGIISESNNYKLLSDLSITSEKGFLYDFTLNKSENYKIKLVIEKEKERKMSWI